MADSKSPQKAPGPEAQPAGERRVVTALFCDVVNSTAMAEQLDPEEWAELMNEAFQTLTRPIVRLEGTVIRLMGDAVLALFGAPAAHEDDPRRAVLAALEMLNAAQTFAQEIKRRHQLDFQVRIGINTGPVVTGNVTSAGSVEYTAMGDAVNVAARMEQTAQPGTIQVSKETHRLVAPLFEMEARGTIELKGKSEPTETYRVLGTKAQPGRLRGIHGVSAPLIGREREFTQLKEALERVRQGSGQVVCLIGEAGLGKSRLLEELRKEWERTNPLTNWEQNQGIAYDSSRPYGLFQNFARGMFGIELADTPEVIHRKVDSGLRARGGSDEAVALCSVTMERVIAAKVLHDAPDFPADVIKKDIYELAYPAFRASSLARGPTVLVVDDLHWADQASVDLLNHVMQLVDEVPVLMLLAFRPERQSPAWQAKVKAETDYPHRYTEIVLRPLDERGTQELISALLRIADLPNELRQLILRKTEGNPYFVEEVVRTLIEQGVVYQTEDGLRWKATTKLEEIAIPDTLQALLMARIDRLDQETRAVLQLAAVIGRSFYYRVLKEISDSALTVDKHLHSLERVELLRQAARLPELEYIFKHELARDAAYGTILQRRRRELHRQVGEAIERLFPERLEENAHRLGQHFALAGEHERALRYYTMAGEAAAGLFANAEAARHYARACEAAGRIGLAGQELERLRSRQASLQALSATSA